jgi:hypothetical protein
MPSYTTICTGGLFKLEQTLFCIASYLCACLSSTFILIARLELEGPSSILKGTLLGWTSMLRKSLPSYRGIKFWISWRGLRLHLRVAGMPSELTWAWATSYLIGLYLFVWALIFCPMLASLPELTTSLYALNYVRQYDDSLAVSRL